MKAKGASGEPMSIFATRIGVCQKQSVVITYVDETTTAVGAIGGGIKLTSNGSFRPY